MKTFAIILLSIITISLLIALGYALDWNFLAMLSIVLAVVGSVLLGVTIVWCLTKIFDS